MHIHADGLPRNSARKIGRWANCISCGEEFASFKNNGLWAECCSVSCRNKHIASLRPKKLKAPKKERRPRAYCSCGAPLRGYKTKSCKTCHMAAWKSSDKAAKKELGGLRETERVLRRHAYQAVRNHAKRMMRVAGCKKACAQCGWARGIQVCHIKPISSFPDSATVGEINVLDNLVYLCPNHHWDLDHGHLSAEELRRNTQVWSNGMTLPSQGS